ncbi:protein FAR1-RELATED SEQUENCE 5-like [Panicum miliaceum]|uniref:Protein FAR1-RELATED SEQUENCE 5-like n=1 Tax=Panicum miliaceum TaxID=4540 RepID=A0A3L6QHL9_PANMI|nr:protein FAR1-RELATED SEQUENCE 5-like [Panicum miliaceum]
MSQVEPAAAGADQAGEGAVVPHDEGVGGGGGVATTEAQVAVAVSTSGDERRVEYGDDADNEGEEAATVQGSKEGTEELLRKVVYSEEAAYKLYCDYGHRMGFSIRKGKQSYFTGTKRIRTKDYFCSKEGLKEGEKLTDANFNDPHTRTNCRAMVRFRVNDHGEWKVIRLVSDHNHNLARPEERHLLRSARSLIAGRSSSEAMVYAGYQMFTKCIQGCDSETEFEETWAQMIHEFKLQDNKWLKKLYKLKQKWCSALNKRTFDGGVEYEPQCDSMSNIFNSVADKLTSLSAIAVAVDKLSEDWREKELEEDTRCLQKPPACIIKHSDILNHAAKVYTHRIYKLFETDFLDGCGATKFKELPCEDNNTHQFEMTMQGRGSRVCTECMDDDAAYCNYVMHYAYDLVTKSQGQEELRKALWETLENGEKELEKYLGNGTQYAPSYAA